ncbi:MAG: helix-turn-helix domain-containing protein [Pseudomonadota bacterium]
MRTLTIRIEPDTLAALDRAGQQFVETWQTGEYAGEYLSFESPAALFRLLTPARWSVLETLQKAGHCGLRELARLLGRDASAVHRDVVALTERGLIEKDEAGKLFVPFARIHAEIDLMSQAA